MKEYKKRADVNGPVAHRLISISTLEQKGDIEPPTKAQVSLLMAQLGRKGGKIGGKRRLETMTADERIAIAQKAARARWGSKRLGRAKKG